VAVREVPVGTAVYIFQGQISIGGTFGEAAFNVCRIVLTEELTVEVAAM
jgi:hypothetical protein